MLSLAGRALQRLRPSDTADTDDHPLTSGMRLLLAATVLILTAIHPSANSRFLAVTYGVLVFYFCHAAAIYLFALGDMTAPHSLRYSIPWVDTIVGALLVVLNGWSSIYFVLFLFGLLVTSLRWGFAAGAPAIVGAIGLFMAVGYLSHRDATVLDLDHAIVTCVVLGYMILFRGDYERRLRQRLRLLRDIGTLSNPRLGPNRMLSRSLEQLRAFYDADFCIAILPTHDGLGHEVRRATRGSPDAAHEAREVSPALASTLLSLRAEVVYFRPGFRGAVATAAATGITARTSSSGPLYQTVAELLGTHAYLSVPLRARATIVGRMFVTANAPSFDSGDLEFLLQVADRLMPLLEHMDLVERMATQAAEDERHRIALDIHDRLIQPYIGLQLGIDAVRQLASRYPESALPRAVRDRIGELVRLSAVGIQDLRGYTRELRGAPASRDLVESLRRFSRRFREATGINVELDLQADLHLNDHLTSEILSMALEAVSNVRRHTDAPSATIVLRTVEQRVVLRVENQTDPGIHGATFVPRSITERAAAINGTTRVEVVPGGTTAIVVEIPL